MKTASLKVEFWGKSLSKQSFKQSCCLSLCIKDCSVGDHLRVSCQGTRMPRCCCSAAPIGPSTAGVSLWRPWLVGWSVSQFLPFLRLSVLWFLTMLKSPGSREAAPSSLLPVRARRGAPCCPPQHRSCTPPFLPLCRFSLSKHLFHAHLFYSSNKPDLSSFRLTFRCFSLQQFLQE